jgi:hypothetical protein
LTNSAGFVRIDISMKIVFLFAGAVFVFMPLSVSALGISAIPSKVLVTSTVHQPEYKALTLKNPSQEAAIFDVFIEDFQEIVRVEPRNFLLESNQKKTVQVVVLPQEAGVFSTDISVVARSLSAQSFKGGTGLKIPLVIQAEEASSQKNWSWYIVAIDIILGVALLGGVGWYGYTRFWGRPFKKA